MIRHLSMLLYFVALVAPAASAADWGPWEAPAPPADRQQAGFSPLTLGVRFFQHYISPLDGPRCPMYPTCSAYALQALEHHGALTGSLLTVDRLLHELEPDARLRTIQVGDRLRYHDPLENNDYWLPSRRP